MTARAIPDLLAASKVITCWPQLPARISAQARTSTRRPELPLDLPLKGPGIHQFGVRIYAFYLGWSYGDSNPRPLACHEVHARPLTSANAA